MADFQRTQTTQAIIERVMGGLGLPAPSSVFSSQDGNVQQMIQLLNDLGQDLISANEEGWRFLTDVFLISTTAGQKLYDLPTDFDHFIPDADWNFSTRRPMVPANDQKDWQRLRVRVAGSLINVVYRIIGEQIELFDSPSAGVNLQLPYITRAWVRRANGSFADNTNSGDDVLLYDSALLREGLKLRWMLAKGFDTTAQSGIYMAALGMASVKNFPQGKISLGNRSQVLLGSNNIPETGFGSS